MKAEKVKPKDWLDENYIILILYDNEEENYSVIWGKYKSHKTLGVRWRSGATQRGYPGQGGHPTWYVEPDFIAITILQRILLLAIDNNDTKYLGNIKFAISELTDKMME